MMMRIIYNADWIGLHAITVFFAIFPEVAVEHVIIEEFNHVALVIHAMETTLDKSNWGVKAIQV